MEKWQIINVRENRRDDQEWTIKGTWQHGQMLEKTEGAIKNGQLREPGNMSKRQRKPKGQSRMDN